MSYEPTTWVDNGPPAINAARLNHIEAGVAAAGSGGGSSIVLPARMSSYGYDSRFSRIGDLVLDPAFSGGDCRLYQATADPFTGPPAACWTLLPYVVQAPYVWDDTTTWVAGKACLVANETATAFFLWKCLTTNTGDQPPSANWRLVGVPPVVSQPMGVALAAPWIIGLYGGWLKAMRVYAPEANSYWPLEISDSGVVTAEDIAGGHNTIGFSTVGQIEAKINGATVQVRRFADASGSLINKSSAADQFSASGAYSPSVALSTSPLVWNEFISDTSTFSVDHTTGLISVLQPGWIRVDFAGSLG